MKIRMLTSGFYDNQQINNKTHFCGKKAQILQPLTGEEKQVVEKNLGLVDYVMSPAFYNPNSKYLSKSPKLKALFRRIVRGVPKDSYEYEEYKRVGERSLMKAAQSFDAQKKVPFVLFACNRIAGEIVDFYEKGLLAQCHTSLDTEKNSDEGRSYTGYSVIASEVLTPQDELVRNEELNRIYDTLKKLKLSDRESRIFEMSYKQGYLPDEIGNALRIPEKEVKQVIDDVMKKIAIKMLFGTKKCYYDALRKILSIDFTKMTAYEISRKLDIPEDRIHFILKRLYCTDNSVKIFKLYKKDKDIDKIAAEVGVSYDEVGQVLKEYGINIPAKEEGRNGKVIEIYKKENDVYKVAAETGFSPFVVRQILVSRGFKIVNKEVENNLNILKLYRIGRSPEEIAIQLHCPVGDVLQLLYRNKINMNDNLQSTLVRNLQIFKLCQKGKTVEEIAAELSFLPEVVGDVLYANGIIPILKEDKDAEERNISILKLYKAAKNVREIVAQTGFAPDVVRGVLKANGIKVSDALDEEISEKNIRILELCREGMTTIKIANEVDCEPDTVISVLRTNGIDLWAGKGAEQLEKRLNVIRLLKKGIDATEICDTLGVSNSFVSTVKTVNRINVPSKIIKASVDNKLKVMEFRKKGMSVEEIAVKTGHDFRLINDILLVNGFNVFDKGTEEKIRRNIRILELCKKGMSVEEIAADVNREVDFVENILFINRSSTFSMTPQQIAERNIEILKMYQNGQFIEDMAQTTGCSYKQIWQVLKENCTEVRSLKEEKDNSIFELYNKGETMAAIGRALDMPECTVWYILHKNGWAKSVKERIMEKDERYASRIVAMYKNDFSPVQIATEINKSVEYVRKILKQQGIDIRKEMDEKIAERNRGILEMSEKKFSIYAIAVEFNLSLRYLRSLLSKLKAEKEKGESVDCN